MEAKQNQINAVLILSSIILIAGAIIGAGMIIKGTLTSIPQQSNSATNAEYASHDEASSVSPTRQAAGCSI